MFFHKKSEMMTDTTRDTITLSKKDKNDTELILFSSPPKSFKKPFETIPISFIEPHPTLRVFH